MKPITEENDTFNKWRTDTNLISSNLGDPASIYKLDGKGFSDAYAPTAVGSNIITVGTHSVLSGDVVEYIAGSTPISGLVNGSRYYARDIVTNASFKLAATSGGTALTLGALGVGNKFIHLGTPTVVTNVGTRLDGAVVDETVERNPAGNGLVDDWDIVTTLNKINDLKVKRTGDWIESLHVKNKLYVSGDVYLGARNSADVVWFRSPTLSTTRTTLSIFDVTATTITMFGKGTNVQIGDSALVGSSKIDLHTETVNVKKDLAVTGNSVLTGNLTVDGNTTLGNAATDTITLTAQVSSNQTFTATDKVISIVAPTTTNSGNKLTIRAGNATTTGNGGGLDLISGASANTGAVNAGTVYVDTGSLTGTGTAPVNIGTVNAKTITIGRSSGVTTTVNNVTITAPATGATLTIAGGKTLTSNITTTLAGTDSLTLTTQPFSMHVASTNNSQTFTNTTNFEGDVRTKTVTMSVPTATIAIGNTTGNLVATPLTATAKSVTGVSTTTEGLTVTGHGFAHAQRVTYTVTGGSAIAGLTNTTAYYVIYVDANTIKLASSASNANTNNAINMTATLPTGTHSLTPIGFSAFEYSIRVKQGNNIKLTKLLAVASGLTVDTVEYGTVTVGDFYTANNSISGVSADVITTSAAHGLIAGRRVKFTGTGFTNLTSGNFYYVKTASGSTLTLSATSGGPTIQTVMGTGGIVSESTDPSYEVAVTSNNVVLSASLDNAATVATDFTVMVTAIE